MTQRHLLWTTTLAILALGICSLLYAAAASKVVWEGEAGTITNGKAFATAKKRVDPAGGASQDYVVYIANGEKGKKPAEDSVTYKVNVPADGTYYLWARVRWSTGCGNSFGLSVEGFDGAAWVLGGDGTYDTFHWIVLGEGGKPENAIGLKLKKGNTTFTLHSKEPGVMLDQVYLTTDVKARPAGTYTPTKDGLAK